MQTINLVQGDLTPIIVLTTTGVDLTNKPLRFEMRRAQSREPVVLEALRKPSGDVHVVLEVAATATPGMYQGQLVIDGEQTSFEQVQIYVRAR